MSSNGADFSSARPILEAVIPDLASRLARFTTETDYLDADILAAFLSHLEALLRDGDAARARDDLDAVRKIGHSIKGMGGACGAPEVSAAGEALESAARAGDAARCAILLDALRQWREMAPS